ncbi:MAG: helix-turn-helix transcriptional regulator [Rhodovulum sp.]|nr:helix-turn-helix transcriptional regulator [Rhodovulum sp.]
MPKKLPNQVDAFVGRRVRIARLEANMSQEKLGEALGLTFQQVQKYEKGTNRIGSSRMAQIAAAVGKPIAWFYQEVDQPETPASDMPGRLLDLAAAPPYVRQTIDAIHHLHSAGNEQALRSLASIASMLSGEAIRAVRAAVAEEARHA